MKKLLYCGCCWWILSQSAFAIVPEDPKKSCEELGYKTTYNDCIAARGTPLLCPFYSLTNPLTSCYVRSCRGYSLTDDDLDAVASDGKTYREHTENLSSCVVGVGEDKTTLYQVDSCKNGSLYNDGLCDVGCNSTRYPYVEHQGSLAGDMRSCSDERGEWFGYYTCNDGWVGGWKDTGDGHCNLASCSLVDYPYNHNPNEDENRGAVQTCKIGGNAYYKYKSCNEGFDLIYGLCVKTCQVKNCSSGKNADGNYVCDLDNNCHTGDYVADGDKVVGVILSVDSDKLVRVVNKDSDNYSKVWAEGDAKDVDITTLTKYGWSDFKNDYEGKHNTKLTAEFMQTNGYVYPYLQYALNFEPSGCSSAFCRRGEWYIPAIGEMNSLLLNFNFINNASNRQFPSGWFFSSTRYEANNQWCVVFSRGQFYPQSKSNLYVSGMAFLSFKKK